MMDVKVQAPGIEKLRAVIKNSKKKASKIEPSKIVEDTKTIEKVVTD